MTDPETPGKSDPGEIIRNWWHVNIAERDSGAAKALAARLRRRGDIEILCEPAVHQLAQALHLRDTDRLYSTDRPLGSDRLLRIVRVLAEFRGDDRMPLARRLGGPDLAISPARFQRLMRSDSKALTAALVRAAHMLGPAETRSCNIARLGQDLLLWDHPRWGDRIRARWSFEYFDGSVPETLQPQPEQEPAT